MGQLGVLLFVCAYLIVAQPLFSSKLPQQLFTIFGTLDLMSGSCHNPLQALSSSDLDRLFRTGMGHLLDIDGEPIK